MKKRKKILGLVILIVTIIIAIIYFVSREKVNNVQTQVQSEQNEEYIQVLSDGTKINTSTTLNQNKKIDNLSIENIQLTYRNGVSVVLANIINTGSSRTDLILFELTLINKDGSTIETLEGVIGELNPQESTQLNIGTSKDISNAYDFIIKEK